MDTPEVELGLDGMVEFMRAFQRFDKANAAVMVYSEYGDDEDFYKGIIDPDLLKEYTQYYDYIKALVNNDGDPADIELLDIHYEPISVRANTIDYTYLVSLMQDKADRRGKNRSDKDVEIEKTLAELIKQNPAKGEVYRQINEDLD